MSGINRREALVAMAGAVVTIGSSAPDVIADITFDDPDAMQHFSEFIPETVHEVVVGYFIDDNGCRVGPFTLVQQLSSCQPPIK